MKYQCEFLSENTKFMKKKTIICSELSQNDKINQFLENLQWKKFEKIETVQNLSRKSNSSETCPYQKVTSFVKSFDQFQ